MSQVDEHRETSQVGILQLEVLLVQQLCLLLHFTGFLEELNKNGHLGTQHVRLDWLDDIVDCAQRIAPA